VRTVLSAFIITVLITLLSSCVPYEVVEIARLSSDGFIWMETDSGHYNKIGILVGDCSQYSARISDWADTMGIPWEMKSESGHVYTRVYVDDRWYRLEYGVPPIVQ